MKNAMRWAIAIGVVLAVALAIAASQSSATKLRTVTAEPTSKIEAATRIVVYYFHGNVRCATCRKIEAYSEEAVKTTFAAELKSGAIEWRVLNIEEPANAHFIQEYQLYTRSLVLADAANPKRFKNLEKVWALVGQKDFFFRYVQDEIRAYRDN